MRNLIEIAKKEFLNGLPHDGLYADFYLGSGVEALNLAKYASEGRIYGFGNVEEIEASCKIFEAAYQDNIRFIQDTPLNLEVYLNENLDGVLCRTANDCRLRAEDLIDAFDIALPSLKVGGRILYINHNNKFDKVIEYLSGLPYREFFVYRISSPNDLSAPRAILVEKR